MTVQEARALAQTDPVPTIVARWGEAAAEARRQVDRLEDALRTLAKQEALLAEHDLTVSTDLGPTGNAAKAAWVTTLEHRERHDHDFVAPVNRVA